MSTKYLAITIAGAVSLGAYEAGATYEILDAIRQHNENPETLRNGDFICIDVLTGASAGGMTAAILAQKLLYQKATFVDKDGKSSPYDNPLYNTWVKTISLAGLLNTTDKPSSNGGDPATLSILSSNLIEQISHEALGQQAPPGQVPILGGMHNAVDPDRGIHLGLALTNINGINYGCPMFDGTKFRYTEFCDQMLRALSAKDASAAPWQEIEEAAVACGAFPFAFRTKDLPRVRKDYLPCPTLEPWPNDAQTFTYTDGGVLQNQPLGMAKGLVDCNDQHLNNERRFYLFVSPAPMAGDENWNLREANTSLLGVGKRLLDIYTGQAGFRDWIQAEDINQQIALLDDRAQQLAQVLGTGELDATALTATSTQILELLYSTDGGADAMTADLQRLTAQYAAEIGTLGGATTPQAKAFLTGVLTLEKSANLGERDCMKIYGVVTQDNQLAGGGLSAFLGFFDQAFRDHDYDWGRTVAQQLLANPAFSTAGQLGPIRYTPAAIRPIDAALNGLKLCNVPPADVKTLKDGLTSRANALIGATVSNLLVRGPARVGADLILGALVDWGFSVAAPASTVPAAGPVPAAASV